ncbi:hypothetical protein Aperf_G00000036043 [Anoplocephala perfoliata]
MLFSLVIYVLLSAFTVTAQQSLNINISNWTAILYGEWMVGFFAPWCPACKLVAPEWEKFAALSPKYDVKVADIDCSEESAVAMIFTLPSLPTIFHVKNGEFRNAKGRRRAAELVQFIENRRTPFTQNVFLSSTPFVVRFLSLTLGVTNAHRALIAYGVPATLSILLVGTGVIASGGVLGFILICVCEYLCPPRPQILNVVGMEGEPPEPIVTKENDTEEDCILDDSEDNSWTRVKPPDDKGETSKDEIEDNDQTDKSPAVHHRKSKK